MNLPALDRSIGGGPSGHRLVLPPFLIKSPRAERRQCAGNNPAHLEELNQHKHDLSPWNVAEIHA
jgi:hypothetical protein